ncbi:MAG: cupin domain-containing protein [Haloarculaceae archaeon]
MTTVSTLSELDGKPHAQVFPDAEPKTVRLTLAAGESVPAHTHPGRRIVCYLRTGRLDLTVGAETTTLTEGDVARFSGEKKIAPTAVEDSVALLVLASAADG